MIRALLFGLQPTLLDGVATCLVREDVDCAFVTSYRAAARLDAGDPARITRLPQAELCNGGADFVTALEDHAAQIGANVIVPTDGRSCRMLAGVPPGHGPVARFPLARPEVLDLLDDKWRFYGLLRRLGLPSPDTTLIHEPDDPAVASIGFPAIVKPPAAGGGLGVHRVDSPAALHALAAGSLVQWPMLMQQFVPGQDVDISVLADRGRLVASTVQEWDGPDNLRFGPDREATEIAARILRETGFTGVAHFDLRRSADDGALKVIECNPRFWATVAASADAGVNFAALGVQIALGAPVAPAQARPVRVRTQAPLDWAGLGPRGRII